MTAARIFSALQPLHGLPAEDVELLYRAAAGLRFIRSTGTYTRLEHELFRIALAELGRSEALVVESAACWAADLVPYADSARTASIASAARLRTLWFAAILRLSEPFGSHGGCSPEGVFATWSDEFVYVEFDGATVSESRLTSARERVAALEVLTGRTVCIAGSAARRGAA